MEPRGKREGGEATRRGQAHAILEGQAARQVGVGLVQQYVIVYECVHVYVAE